MSNLINISSHSNTLPVKLSICCVTFNHEKFIRQTFDGFLAQKTNFRVEILVNDDASTDGTTEIIKEYHDKHPDLFKPIYQNINQYSIYKGGMNPRFNYPRANGAYIAVCEGDDYWTDPLKLQKQVEFLESNKNFILSFHNTNDLSENGNFEPKYKSEIKDKYTIKDFSEFLYSRTLSVVFRKPQNFPPKFTQSLKMGDWPISIYLLQFGNAYYMPEIMGVYRKHNSGVWNSSSSKNKVYKIFESFYILRQNLRKEHQHLITPKLVKLSKKYALYQLKDLNFKKALSGLGVFMSSKIKSS